MTRKYKVTCVDDRAAYFVSFMGAYTRAVHTLLNNPALTYGQLWIWERQASGIWYLDTTNTKEAFREVGRS